jgi:hypothetical protein
MYAKRSGMLSEYIEPIVKLGFPTVLALLFITWFFYKYLPAQQKTYENFTDAQRKTHEHLAAEQQRSHEKVVGIMASAFKEALERIVAHNSSLHESHTSKIESMRSTVESMRSDVTGIILGTDDPERRRPKSRKV